MNQTVLFRILFLLFTGYSTLIAELLKPTIGGEEKEILKISGKRRIYTIMRDDSLIYQVNGPARIELITRYPSPEKSKKSQPFSYQLVVNNEEPIIINHRYKLQKNIRSVQHPSHYYTYSGNYFINIKDGNHTLSMSTNAEQKYPVLLRVIKKRFKTSLDKVNDLQKEADVAIEDFATGKTRNIHETMIAVNKADLAFRLTMQVRNKMVEAYQEVMRLQV